MRTIYAAATPAGRAALGVIRIAGPNAHHVLTRLAPQRQFTPRRAGLANLYDSGGKILDQALVLYFKGPRSYTGDDIVELHLHGSPAVSRAVLAAIGGTGLAHYAEPGEFTRRAFTAGRMDLAQVEGIRDLLAAETELQRQAAVGTAAGKLSQVYEQWRHDIVQASATLTASIDFGEDNELENSALITNVRSRLQELLKSVKAHMASAQCAELVRQGIRVALLGAPNAGKSSLLNKLISRSASLVSEVPGTTRDVIEVSMDVEGHKIVLSDLAGLRSSTDKVEALGIARAREVLSESSIVLALCPTDSEPDEDLKNEIAQLRNSGKHIIEIASKSDVSKSDVCGATPDRLAVSSVTGQGINQLLDALKVSCERILDEFKGDGDLIGATERTRNILASSVVPGLETSLRLLSQDVVLADAELGLALDGIGKITGRGVSLNEVLDVVFGDFCIGK